MTGIKYIKDYDEQKLLLAGHFWPASSASCSHEMTASDNEKNKVTKVLKASIAVGSINMAQRIWLYLFVPAGN